MSIPKFIGIDFSGGARPWRRLVNRPSVWLAIAENYGDKPQLTKLFPVQSLDGDEEPFDRLVKLLATGDFEAAAIDAPFSLPLMHMPKGGRSDFLATIRALPNGPDRPFPLGASVVQLGETFAPRNQLKPLRKTEQYWADRHVNTRSTMWAGPRGGAPFAAACLRLLERSGRPSWPWDTSARGILVEAFPAAQLYHWALPYQGYSGDDGKAVRASIVSKLQERIQINPAHVQSVVASADALDSIVAVFAAIAVHDGTFLELDRFYDDGFIAVAK